MSMNSCMHGNSLRKTCFWCFLFSFFPPLLVQESVFSFLSAPFGLRKVFSLFCFFPSKGKTRKQKEKKEKTAKTLTHILKVTNTRTWSWIWRSLCFKRFRGIQSQKDGTYRPRDRYVPSLLRLEAPTLSFLAALHVCNDLYFDPLVFIDP